MWLIFTKGDDIYLQSNGMRKGCPARCRAIVRTVGISDTLSGHKGRVTGTAFTPTERIRRATGTAFAPARREPHGYHH
jgi:hypothetical protein